MITIQNREQQEPAWVAGASANVQALYRYWQGKRTGTDLPARADIDPVDIPALLPYLTIVEVVADARRYVYRLVGTKEVEIRGQDPTGKSVAEAFYGPNINEAHMFYDKAVATRDAVYDCSPFIGPDGRYNDDEILFLPLSDDGSRVTRIVVMAQCSLTPEFA
jgi:hypothetical protein